MPMKKSSVFILVLLFFVSGYQNSQKETTFSSMFSDVPMNVALRFWKPSEDFRIGEPVSLDLENISLDEIGIPIQNGQFALVYYGNEWIKLNNTAIYIPPNGERHIFPKGLDDPGVISIDLDPQLDTNDKSTYIRVLVVGFIYKNGQETNQKTGAYIDIDMKP